MQPSYHAVSPFIAVITSFVSASDFDLIEAGFPDEVGDWESDDFICNQSPTAIGCLLFIRRE
jgi:hypothetical protein